ncbi:hypothetical protein ASZ90_002675 [hydrocarbon metagenome]|uniref:Uncharacterized protein n=1 Tax=hydrocarbon metagenome TaxID=938273 RepID=A0A0W8G2U7_9ZZZZ
MCIAASTHFFVLCEPVMDVRRRFGKVRRFFPAGCGERLASR